LLRGISGIKKISSGPVLKASSRDVSIDAPCVLVIPDVRAFDIWPHIPYIVALIVESGSAFSHIGVTVRELGIPAMYDVQGAMDQLCDGDMIEVNGYDEIVRTLPPFGSHRRQA
jgi:phosphoenolpyruvate-protein kinase (PTS system EI component)